MKPGHHLTLALARTGVLIAVAVSLHDIGPFFDASPVEPTASNGDSPQGSALHFNYLAWPLALAAALALLRSVAYWMQSNGRIIRLLSRFDLPDSSDTKGQSQPNRVLVLIHGLLGNAVWLVMILGLILAVPHVPSSVSSLPEGPDLTEIRPYLDVFESMTPWALLVLTPFALVRTAFATAPAVERIAPVPYLRLLAVGVAYLLLAQNGVLATAIGFRSDELLWMVAIALALPYLAGVLGRVLAAVERDTISSGFKARLVTVGPKIIPILAVGCAGAALTWGLLTSLPDLSAALLANDLTARSGEASLLHLGQLYDVRYLFAGSILVLLVSSRLPHNSKIESVSYFRPYLAAIGMVILGYTCWLLGARLAPLGHGFLLIGASVAVGLFLVALGELARYARLATLQSASRAAGWLSESRLRMFLIGVSIGSYVLLVRPLFYEVLWFAQLFEWLVVVAIAVIVLKGLTDRVRNSVVSATHEPDTWTNWVRHGQTVKVLPDARFEAMLDSQRAFVETGEWRSIWAYLLGLMYRNGVRPADAEAAFVPLRNYSEASGSGLFLNKLLLTKGKREKSLLETQRVAREALASPPIHQEAVDEPAIRAMGDDYAKNEARPDSLAVALVAAYWQNGARLTQAVDLWFPLMALTDFSPRWFYGRRAREEVQRRNQGRRKRIVDSAIAHLFGGETEECLPVAIIGREVAVFPRARTNGKVASVGSLQLGQVVEIVRETQATYQIRTADGIEGYIATDEMVRQPLLPKDREAQRSQHEPN